MNKEFIPYEQALVLKELGFDEPCLAYHNIDPYLPKPTFNLVRPFDHEWCLLAPLYQQAFRWFREKYDLHAYVDSMRLTTGETVYSYVIEITDGEESDDGKNWRTYEEAKLACLIKLIEIVKNK
jgi:hypothetical protein